MNNLDAMQDVLNELDDEMDMDMEEVVDPDTQQIIEFNEEFTKMFLAYLWWFMTQFLGYKPADFKIANAISNVQFLKTQQGVPESMENIIIQLERIADDRGMISLINFIKKIFKKFLYFFP